METKEDLLTLQAEEPFPKSSLYGAGEKSPMEEMIPLKDTTIQVESAKEPTACEQPPVKDHLVWSIVNTIHMNFCCLGLIALIFSVKSWDQKLLGNQSVARKYGAKARCLNIASSVLTVLCFLISAIIIYVNLLHLKAVIRGWFGK
ncbi:interferon-induced transmembrane protein 5-like [Leptodactylus fuscus]|uniref:interferon-induced transmembrane protein 5-like n=1 Tax=Leptodactylus fuscus TaxID=238119 RepID=UPI003F4EDE5C